MPPVPGSEVAVASRRRLRIRVEGIVQGVGFRPFVYRLAHHLGLAGHVRNDASGVRVEVEGTPARVVEFLARLPVDAPPLAQVERVSTEELSPLGESGFEIVESAPREVPASVAGPAAGMAGIVSAPSAAGTIGVAPSWRTSAASSAHPGALVPPDVATCDACLRELFDPADRRYRYPFINCTHCGPRFTIVRGLPYDRPLTTMADFPMCARCRAEYEDPTDRRFHAQPNACPECGPRIWVVPGDNVGAGARAGVGERVSAGDWETAGDPIRATAAALSAGAIVALKGLGGFHLACLARDADAVQTLRERKRRPAKPFALMAPDLERARRLVHLDAAEESLLSGRERPIVLARRWGGAEVAPGVAPRQRELGVMLPYTPLHHLLLGEIGEALVMTSGNLSDEPIAYRNDDALSRLARIADLFLLHDRPIHVGVDDSVARVVTFGSERRPQLIRRSRGYAPRPLPLPVASPYPVLACGAQLKNTFCLALGEWAWPSHHIGDLGGYEALRAFGDGVAHLEALFELRPVVLAHDLHPEYAATKYATDRVARAGSWEDPAGADAAVDSATPVELMENASPAETAADARPRLLGIQHHHAHLAACLAEHGEVGPALGVAFDGTGYGPDGMVWGGEFLLGDLAGYQRLAHLFPVRLPGGEAAIREPWRMACAWLVAAGEMEPAGMREPAGKGELIGKGGVIGKGERAGRGESPGVRRPARDWERPGIREPAGVGEPFGKGEPDGAGMRRATDRSAAPPQRATPALPATLAGMVDPARWAAVAQLARSGVASPLTSSMGRLFDAVGALCGLGAVAGYEGEVAIALAAVADPDERGWYELPVIEACTPVGGAPGEVPGPADGVPGGGAGEPVLAADAGGGGATVLTRILDPRPLIRAVLAELEADEPVAAIAARFHNSLVRATTHLCARLAEEHGVRTVVLTGGVFQNRALLERSTAELARSGLRVLVPERLPPNDGGIAYGQAAIAAARGAARGQGSRCRTGPVRRPPPPCGP